jgi:CRISPR-associated protein Cmr1
LVVLQRVRKKKLAESLPVPNRRRYRNQEAKEGERMNKTVIRCKTTAPMFMAGGQVKPRENSGRRDTREKKTEQVPEIRVPGIKGVMRFVWRAIQRSPEIKKLRKEEGELFGIALDDNTKQSEMRMKIANVNEKKGEYCSVAHRQLHGDYKGNNKPFRTPGIDKDATFDVIITSFGHEKRHENFVRLFAVTCVLSGFGKRSRKGYGTVAIEKIDGIGGELDFSWERLAENLNELSGARKIYTQEKDIIVATSVPKPDEYPYIEQIKIARRQSDTKNLYQQIGLAVHNHSGKTVRGNTFLGNDYPRLASSILLSTLPDQQGGYKAIVTQLHYIGNDIKVARNNFYKELYDRV